jgi:hypothetical protein
MNETEQRLRESLSRFSAPDEQGAADRSWELVRAAYAEQPEPQRSPRVRRHVLQVALIGALVVALISPAGAAVRNWVADTVDPGVTPSRPVLTSLPAKGSLLVQSSVGTWVVHPDGSRRLLGDYSGATWSPRGLYVAATSDHELTALEPNGKIRWTLARAGQVRQPSWNAPDGFRIAYLDNTMLRVVNGDGSGNHLLRRGAAPVAPAWRPGNAYVVAFAKTNGAVEAVRADDGRRVFSTASGPMPLWLQWSHDGARLLIVRPNFLELRSPEGKSRWRLPAPTGSRIIAARLSPSGKLLAVVVAGAGRSRVLLSGPHSPTHVLFSGPGQFSGVEWSPDGQWILLAWQSADQWLFLAPHRPNRIIAVSHIAKQFSPRVPGSAEHAFPAIKGWCCSR